MKIMAGMNLGPLRFRNIVRPGLRLLDLRGQTLAGACWWDTSSASRGKWLAKSPRPKRQILWKPDRPAAPTSHSCFLRSSGELE